MFTLLFSNQEGFSTLLWSAGLSIALISNWGNMYVISLSIRKCKWDLKDYQLITSVWVSFSHKYIMWLQKTWNIVQKLTLDTCDTLIDCFGAWQPLGLDLSKSKITSTFHNNLFKKKIKMKKLYGAVCWTSWKKAIFMKSCFGHFFVCLFFKLYRAGFMKTFLKKLQNVTDKVEKTSKAVFFSCTAFIFPL